MATAMSNVQPGKASAPTDGRGLVEAQPSQVQQWLGAGECVLIDVREPDEHARERINGAKLLPLSRFDPAAAAALVKAGQRLVFHCRSGKRSADACRMAAGLAGTGVTMVSMAGGIEAWKGQGLGVEVNTKVSGISVMRQVQMVIGSCVLIGSVLAWLVNPMFVGIPAFFGAGLVFAGASGICGLATVMGMMPWNRVNGKAASCEAGGSRSDGKCG